MRGPHLAENILDHDDRAIHQNAEVHCANGKEIGGDIFQVQADKGEQHRQRDGGGDDQAGANIVEEEE